MSEQMTAPVEICGEFHNLIFKMELCGSAAPGRHLYQYVCESCRQQNPRGRDEWVSPSFLDENSDEARERMSQAFDAVAVHVHTHEVIGGWAAKILRPAPTPDRIDTLDLGKWAPSGLTGVHIDDNPKDMQFPQGKGARDGK